MLDSSSQPSHLPILLLVDDDINVLSALKRTLRGVEATIVCYDSPVEALEFCRHNRPEVIISDQKMPGLEGVDLLERIQELWPRSQRIILSAYQEFQKVSAGFNSGAIDKYICKPWDNQELKFIIDKALTRVATQSTEEHVVDKSFIASPTNFHSMIASDESMKELFNDIRHAATSNAPIFVTGETGTGKELVAKACHLESFHREQPFLAVNCANFTENLMESQLFGHTKGAYTGATSAQEGVFAAAKNGTLFLDEITTLSKSLQAKLLRVIQEREYTPLGSNKVEKFHAQLISASSNSIRDAVANGDFRDDLFYRLNIVTFNIPALRDRGGDILLIANYFLKKYAEIEHKDFQRFSRDCIQILCQYDWPGNVRQLENIVHSMIIINSGIELNSQMIIKALSSSIIPLNHSLNQVIKAKSNTSNEPISKIMPLWMVEKQAIEHAISHCRGNVPQAAALLEVSPSTIYRKKQNWDECP